MNVFVPVASMWQPYASLLVRGRKRLETRPRRINEKYLGQWMYIQAALKTVSDDDYDNLPDSLIAACDDEFGCHWNLTLTRGAVVGRVKFDALLRTENHSDQQTEEELAMGNWAPGRWAYHVSDREEFKQPIPCKGKQALPFMAELLQAA